MKDLKSLFIKAHKMTREIRERFIDVDYKTQFGLCLRELYSQKKDFLETHEVACTRVEELSEQETICFTGKGEFDRNTLIEMAVQHGHKISTSGITRKTTLLVVGSLKEKSSKIRKAESLGIRIMSATEFVQIMSRIAIAIA